jgi:hypothetical protein
MEIAFSIEMKATRPASLCGVSSSSFSLSSLSLLIYSSFSDGNKQSSILRLTGCGSFFSFFFFSL